MGYHIKEHDPDDDDEENGDDNQCCVGGAATTIILTHEGHPRAEDQEDINCDGLAAQLYDDALSSPLHMDRL